GPQRSSRAVIVAVVIGDRAAIDKIHGYWAIHPIVGKCSPCAVGIDVVLVLARLLQARAGKIRGLRLLAEGVGDLGDIALGVHSGRDTTASPPTVGIAEPRDIGVGVGSGAQSAQIVVGMRSAQPCAIGVAPVRNRGGVAAQQISRAEISVIVVGSAGCDGERGFVVGGFALSHLIGVAVV